MRILFLNANMQGHINPTLSLVAQLKEEHHDVVYYCSPDFKQMVEEAGAKYLEQGESIAGFFTGYRPTDRHPFFMLMEYMLLYDEVMIEDIQKHLKHEKYDLILCDSIFGGAYFIKKLSGIPVACSHSSFAMSKAPVPERMLVRGFHPQLDYCYEILTRICTKYQIPQPGLEEIFVSQGDLNLVYTSKEFNQDPALAEGKYLYLGPSIDRKEKELSASDKTFEGKKMVYISLGSVNTAFPDFYRMCVEAFDKTEYYVCISIGNKCDMSQFDNLPENIQVKTFYPQLEMLKHAAVFVTHAGFNSVNEALYFGVPMLALPLVNDQPMVAKRITSLGVGRTADMKEINAQNLKEMIDLIVKNDTMKSSCREISNQMRTCGTRKNIGERLEAFVKGAQNGTEK